MRIFERVLGFEGFEGFEGFSRRTLWEGEGSPLKTGQLMRKILIPKTPKTAHQIQTPKTAHPKQTQNTQSKSTQNKANKIQTPKNTQNSNTKIQTPKRCKLKFSTPPPISSLRNGSLRSLGVLPLLVGSLPPRRQVVAPRVLMPHQ